MGALTVRDIMTDTVIAVREAARYAEIVDALARYRVSAVPVLDAHRRVLGVVSEADLMAKVEFAGRHASYPLVGARARTARAKAAGESAADLMTSPPITIWPDATVVDTARLMDSESVKRLPVVDGEGRLGGIVSRGDVLRAFLIATGAGPTGPVRP